MSKGRVKSERTVLTYSVLRSASWNALEQAKATEEGQFYNCMTAVLFSALTMEAYLNHIGPPRVPYWATLEAKLGPAEKLEVICSHLKLKPDFSRRPWQTLSAMLRFRNDLAHAKTAHLKADDPWDDRQVRPDLPKAQWEKLCTLAFAQRALDDTKDMIEELHARTGIKLSAFGSLGTASWEILRDE